MAMVRSGRVDPASNIAWEPLQFGLTTAISQTGVIAFAYTPGYAFQIVKVRTYCLLLAGTCTGVVSIGARTAVASVTFTSATEVAQTLSATLANIRGSITDQLTFAYTTNGAGVLTNGMVTIVIRAYPSHGEGGPGDLLA